MVRTKQLRALAIGIVATGLVGSSTTPGMAFTPLTITNSYCISQGAWSDGNGSAHCRVWVSGGTGSYTYQWQPGPAFENGPAVTIRCGLGYLWDVTVTVTDSAGATASQTTTFYCDEGV